MIDIAEINETLRKTAEELSIKKYDLYGASGSSTSVSVDAGVADKVTAKDTASCTLRVWDGEKTGSVSTSDLTAEGLESALSLALDVAKLGLQDVSPDFSPEAKSGLNCTSDEIARDRAKPGQLIDKLIEMESKVVGSHEDISKVPYNAISDSTSVEFYVNSEGASRVCEHASSYCYLYSLAQQDGRRARKAFSLKIGRDFSDLNFDECVTETVERTIFSLDYVTLPPEKDYTVVFSPTAFLALFSSFENIWNARSVLDHRSLSTEKSLGEQIAVEDFNFFDDSHHKDNLSKSLFDQEGTPTKKLEIIKGGVLQTFIHNEETAKKFNSPLTGNARIGARPSASTNYYHIFNSNKSADVVDPSTATDIVYVDQVNALHAGVQASQGTFSLPVDGWVTTTDGKKSFESAVVSGDILQLLKNITYMNPQEEVTEYGIAPEVWVSGLKVTG